MFADRIQASDTGALTSSEMLALAKMPDASKHSMARHKSPRIVQISTPVSTAMDSNSQHAPICNAYIASYRMQASIAFGYVREVVT